MASKCAICQKASKGKVWHLAKLRGKYNPTVKVRKKPNLQWVSLDGKKRVKACAKCIKTTGKRN